MLGCAMLEEAVSLCERRLVSFGRIGPSGLGVTTLEEGALLETKGPVLVDQNVDVVPKNALAVLFGGCPCRGRRRVRLGRCGRRCGGDRCSCRRRHAVLLRMDRPHSGKGHL